MNDDDSVTQEARAGLSPKLLFRVLLLLAVIGGYISIGMGLNTRAVETAEAMGKGVRTGSVRESE